MTRILAALTPSWVRKPAVVCEGVTMASAASQQASSVARILASVAGGTAGGRDGSSTHGRGLASEAGVVLPPRRRGVGPPPPRKREGGAGEGDLSGYPPSVSGRAVPPVPL